MIPFGWPETPVLTADGSRLIVPFQRASVAGTSSEDAGAVFVYNVDAMLEQIEKYQTKDDASNFLLRLPIDDLPQLGGDLTAIGERKNVAIDLAADFRLFEVRVGTDTYKDLPRTQLVFGVPCLEFIEGEHYRRVRIGKEILYSLHNGEYFAGVDSDPIALVDPDEISKNTPLATGGAPRGAAILEEVLDLQSPRGEITELEPTFAWKVFYADNATQAAAASRIYVSVFSEGYGLFPWDAPPGVVPQLPHAKERPGELPGWDFHPNRIVNGDYIERNSDAVSCQAEQPGKPDDPPTGNFICEYTLPENRRLTAGQNYNWGVEVNLNGARHAGGIIPYRGAEIH